MGIIAHVDHGKTTTSDSLLAACGMLSPSVAGQALALDYMELEQSEADDHQGGKRHALL